MIMIPIAIVGAGDMGGRHLRALGALYESSMANVELVAVCDTRKENAIHLADNAEEMLGSRPVTVQEIENEETAQYEASINAHWKITSP